MREFFGCYLLESKHPRAKGRSYVGFTVNPRRRIRQHNGEIVSGAAKTKAWRPWEMVLVVFGFPTQVQALQFEWAWQHPERSLEVRAIAARLGRQKRYGVAGKVLLLMEMLRAEPWCYYPLTLQFLSTRHSALRGKCPPPPAHVRVLVAPLEALPEGVEDAEDAEAESGSEGGSDGGSNGEGEAAASSSQSATEPPSRAASLRGADEVALQLQQEEWLGGSSDSAAAAPEGGGAKGSRAKGRSKLAAAACRVCGKAANRTWVPCACCGTRTHVECLARSFLQPAGSGGAAAEGPAAGAQLPSRGTCPGCGAAMTWMDALRSAENAGWQAKGRPRGGGGEEAGAGPAAQQQGSPTDSAAGKRKPRGRKAPAAAGAAAPAADEAAAGASPANRGSHPRKVQPTASADSAVEPSSGGAGHAELLLPEGLPWDSFGLSSPAQPAPEQAGAGTQRQRQHGEPDVELLDSDDDLLVPLAQRLRQAQRQHARPQQRPEPEHGAGAEASCPPAPAAADEAIDLVSPSPLPLLQRLRRGGKGAAHSPRGTPSPAPQRKKRSSSGAAAAAAAPLATLPHPGRQPLLDLGMGGNVIVISDSE